MIIINEQNNDVSASEDSNAVLISRTIQSIGINKADTSAEILEANTTVEVIEEIPQIVITAPGPQGIKGDPGEIDHAELDNLAYANSGHTGFFSTDQTTPQTVSGGAPVFADGLVSGYDSVFGNPNPASIEDTGYIGVYNAAGSNVPYMAAFSYDEELSEITSLPLPIATGFLIGDLSNIPDVVASYEVVAQFGDGVFIRGFVPLLPEDFSDQYFYLFQNNESNMIFGEREIDGIYYPVMFGATSDDSNVLAIDSQLKIFTGQNTNITTDEMIIDLSQFMAGLELRFPLLNGSAYSSLPETIPFGYATGFADRIGIFAQGTLDEPEILFATSNFSNSASIGANLTNEYVFTNWDLVGIDGPYNIGRPDIPWNNGYFQNTLFSNYVDAVSGFKVNGSSPVANGTYTVGKGISRDGTITITGGLITAVQEALN